jgi:hypothetical protein
MNPLRRIEEAKVMESQNPTMFSAETRSSGGFSLVLAALVVMGTLFGGMLLAVNDYTRPIHFCEQVNVVGADGQVTTQVRRC